MRYVTYSLAGQTRVGVLVGEHVQPLAWQGGLLDLIRVGTQPSPEGELLPMSAISLAAPIIPGKIVAVGKNYAAHVQEMKSEVPAAPLLFSKYPSAVIGTGDAITWRTSITNEVDWEAELGVIIGKKGKDIPESAVMDHIFGYTAANDVSARDLQSRIDSQWTRAKGLDTFCPLGPCVVTRDDIADPQRLRLQAEVNGVMMQDGNTQDMIHSVVKLVAYISQMFTLDPGDLILTGTPSGVGSGRTPPIFLKDGDVVTVRVEGVGEISNVCRAHD
jgi:2-keto-4-pentenoate hydratase/2-oxohepta-3-ene-1,7-dioic acid hydratase in catechol pathway